MTISCAFICTLSRDPSELKTGKTGQFCNFSCTAANEGGDPSWINVICFGEVAQTIAKTARKGDSLYVLGAIRLASWQDSEGQTKYGLAVSASRAEKLFAAQPSLPIAPTARKKKRPAFGLFQKKKKVMMQNLSAKPQDHSENGRPFDDALPF